MGIPQGDGLSPVLFIIYLEAAMREVREADAAIYNSCRLGAFPRWGVSLTELSYADDVDFISTNKAALDLLLAALADRFSPWNLMVKVSKTERKIIAHGEKAQYKKLGAHVDTDADMHHRIHQANVVFHSMWKIWGRSLCAVEIRTRILIYNACVKSILLYNVAALPFTQARLLKLETAHRKHLRMMLKIFWPRRISNTSLYRETESEPLRVDIYKRKLWFLFHSLRSDRYTPQRECMEQHFRHLTEAPKHKGAHPILIARELHLLLQKVGLQLNQWGDLQHLLSMAQSHKVWTALVATTSRALGAQDTDPDDDLTNATLLQPWTTRTQHTQTGLDTRPSGQIEGTTRRRENTAGRKRPRPCDDHQSNHTTRKRTRHPLGTGDEPGALRMRLSFGGVTAVIRYRSLPRQPQVDDPSPPSETPPDTAPATTGTTLYQQRKRFRLEQTARSDARIIRDARSATLPP